MRGRRGRLEGRARAGLAAVCVAALALSACGTDDDGVVDEGTAPDEGDAAAESDATDEGEISLRVAWFGNDERHERTHTALDLFEEANPNFELVREPLDWGSYWDRLATQAAGGNMPDVLGMNWTNAPQYAADGLLYDLSEFMPDVIDDSNLSEAAFEYGPDGAIVAIAMGLSSPGMMLNEALLEESGISLPDEMAWTWDDFADLAEEASASLGDGVWGTTDFAAGEPQHFEVWARQHGHELFDEDGNWAVPEDVFAGWLSYWDTLRESGASSPREVTAEGEEDQADSLIVRGQALFDWQSSNLIVAATELSPDPIRLIMMPSLEGEQENMMTRGIFISMAADASDPEAGARVIDHLINDIEAGGALGAERGAPPSSAVRDAIAEDLSEPEQEFLDYLGVILEESRPRNPLQPGIAEVQSLMYEANEAVAFGESVDAAVEAFYSELDRALGSS